MPESGRLSPPSFLGRGPWLNVAVVCVVVLAGVGLVAPWALLVVALDGIPAVAVLGAASLGGLWLVRVLVPGEMPLRWHLLLGAGLGIGALALLVLVLGMLGWLSVPVWYTVLAGMSVAGAVRLRGLVRAGRAPEEAGAWRWLWLAIVPFAVLGVLAATVPPGLLWAEEGNGYDVLEYHFQMPREYFEMGRIEYAPHNVYANFPANAEMLYLLCMVLKGDAVQAVGMAKILNLGLAGLVVAVAWLIGRERSPHAGIVTGVVTGSTGWLVYLSGVAYVENAMLLFGLLSLAVLRRSADAEDGEPRSAVIRRAIVAGLLAGFACGCKYTAVVLIAVPLALLVVGLPRASLARRVTALVAYGAAVMVAFSPWVIKNTVMTGDPVFPLGGGWGGWADTYPEGWGAEEAGHFMECHKPAPPERGLAARVGRLWARVPADPVQRFGPLVLIMAATGMIACWRKRETWLCVLALAVQVGIWLFGTHLYARFAVVLLIPLVGLVAGAAAALPSLGAKGQRVGLGLIVFGVLFNAGFAGRLYYRHLYVDGRKLPIEGVPEVFAQGQIGAYEFYGAVNNELPADARVLLVGEARAFYFDRDVDYGVVFNRNPFVAAAREASGPSEVIDWLRACGYTHVLVNWREINRLRGSRYGFPSEVTPEWFHALVPAGLVPVKPINDVATDRPYAALYRVGPPSAESR